MHGFVQRTDIKCYSLKRRQRGVAKKMSLLATFVRNAVALLALSSLTREQGARHIVVKIINNVLPCSIYLT